MTKKVQRTATATPIKLDTSMVKKHARLFTKATPATGKSEKESAISICSRTRLPLQELLEASEYQLQGGRSSVVMSLDISHKDRPAGRKTSKLRRLGRNLNRKLQKRPAVASAEGVQLPELLLGLQRRLVSLSELVFPLTTIQRAAEVV